MITTDEVAELVAFLCTSGSRPITGQALVVASGYFTF
jgi:enoyl-[acyl-carrier-protein] reductase (NADH)